MRRRRRRSEREAARLYPVRRNKKRHKKYFAHPLLFIQ
jgi:hypothetical protein